MCSRYIKKQTDLTEKPNIKKTKTIQMKYPAPYSQSWSGPPQTSKRASTNGSTTGQYRTLQASALQESDTSEIIQSGMPRVKTPKEASEESSTPLFVVRSIDSRLTRRLTRAASTHLDIKPRNLK